MNRNVSKMQNAKQITTQGLRLMPIDSLGSLSGRKHFFLFDVTDKRAAILSVKVGVRVKRPRMKLY